MSLPSLPAGEIYWTKAFADALLPDDVVWREVLDGELFVMNNAPRPIHQVAVAHLNALLYAARPPGWRVLTSPLDVDFPWGDVGQPDIVVCSPDGFDLVDGVTGPPQLVVEVLSPSTRRNDLVRKRRLYERHAIPAYLIVDVDAPMLTLLRVDELGRLVGSGVGTSLTLAAPFPVTLDTDWS